MECPHRGKTPGMLPNQPPVWKSLESLRWEDNNIVARSKNAKKKGPAQTATLKLFPG